MSRQYKQNATKKRLKFNAVSLAINLSSFCLNSMPRAQYSINLNPSRERRIVQARIKIARRKFKYRRAKSGLRLKFSLV